MFYSFSTRVSADRVTPAWKINYSISLDYEKDKFDTDEEKIVSTKSTKLMDGLLVKSISDHWSLGASTIAVTS